MTEKRAEKDIKSQIKKEENFKIIKNGGNENLQGSANLSPICVPGDIRPVRAITNINKQENIEINVIKHEELALNSYKFSKPRIYVANDYPEAQYTVIDRLK